MVEASSLGLADSLAESEKDMGLLYPRIERIREISAMIAVTVIRAAQKAVRVFARVSIFSGVLILTFRVSTVLSRCAPRLTLSSWNS